MKCEHPRTDSINVMCEMTAKICRVGGLMLFACTVNRKSLEEMRVSLGLCAMFPVVTQLCLAGLLVC